MHNRLVTAAVCEDPFGSKAIEHDRSNKAAGTGYPQDVTVWRRFDEESRQGGARVISEHNDVTEMQRFEWIGIR